MLNYGFINLNNDANEYPFIVKMAEDDKFATQKTEILNQQVQRTFRVQVNFEESIMNRFISFLRFTEFDENIAYLYQLKGAWSQRTKQRPDDSDEPEPTSYWNADDIPAISKQNERRVWQRIKSMA